MVSAIPCVSADSHIIEPPGTYKDRIDPSYRDRAPFLQFNETMGDVMVIDNGQSVVPYHLIAAAGLPTEEIYIGNARRFEDLHPGGHDPQYRLAEQDQDGVVAEVIYPSTGMLLCNHPDYDYKKACFDAYNLWIAEYCSYAPDRLIGLGQTTMRTPEEGIAELEQIKALGLRGVMMPGIPAVEDYDHVCYDDFYRASLDLGLPLSFHILTGSSSGLLGEGVRGPKINGFLNIIRGNQDIMGTMIFGGVFERHPELRVVCAEADAGWVPHYMYRADHAFERHRNWLTPGAELHKKPSEYFRENIYVTFQDDWVAFKMVDLVNTDRLMWANDFPHSDATWPWSQQMLAEHTGHLSEQTRSRILRDNCTELYGIDLA
jgi:predicted TIM-barrel fold metal-dependent hydrolase